MITYSAKEASDGSRVNPATNSLQTTALHPSVQGRTLTASKKVERRLNNGVETGMPMRIE
jgi:hypothetical protein